MVNHCTINSQYELSAIAIEEAHIVLSEMGISDTNNLIDNTIRTIIGCLPEEIRDARTLTRKCKKPSEEALTSLSGNLGVNKDDLFKVKNRICVALRMALYKDFLKNRLDEMVAYMVASEPPNAWGLGYLANIGDWGRDFYDKWTQAIAQVEPEEEFKRLILNKLPENWRSKFKPKDFCEYEWEEMSYQAIAVVLSGLRRKESAKTRWGLGSIESWVDNQGRKTGMSFYNAWITKIAPRDPVKTFRDEILPHLTPRTLIASFNHAMYANGSFVNNDIRC